VARPSWRSPRAQRSQRIRLWRLRFTKLPRQSASRRRGLDATGSQRRLRLAPETGDTVTDGQQALTSARSLHRLQAVPRASLGAGGFGNEADGQCAHLTDNQTLSTSVATSNQFTAGAQQDLEFFGIACGRLGFTPVEPVVLYVTGGLLVDKSSFRGRLQNPACLGFCATTSTSNDPSGWTVGGGLEYAFAPNWSAKVEYLYPDLGTLSQQILERGHKSSSVPSDFATLLDAGPPPCSRCARPFSASARSVRAPNGEDDRRLRAWCKDAPDSIMPRV
jgi:opacity protein-like surface antigen